MTRKTLWRIGPMAAFFLLFGTAATAFAEHGWLLPESISEEGDRIDRLFWFIFIIVGIVFVGTEGLLLLFIWKYRKKEGVKAHYTHGNHKLEVIWTIIPAIILALIAVIQFGLWTELKDPEKFPSDDPDAIEIHVLAKQFEWYFRYPGPDAKWGTDDDFVTQRMIVPEGRPVIMRMRSLDVIHSLYLPTLRFKQDLVPGLTMSGWFKANKAGTYEIACAELCGASHYTMKAWMDLIPSDEWDAKYVELSKEFAPQLDYESDLQWFRFWPVQEIVDVVGEDK